MSLSCNFLDWCLSSTPRCSSGHSISPGTQSLYAPGLLLLVSQEHFACDPWGHCCILPATFPMLAHDGSHKCRSDYLGNKYFQQNRKNFRNIIIKKEQGTVFDGIILFYPLQYHIGYYIHPVRYRVFFCCSVCHNKCTSLAKSKMQVD